jgi:hypothetical protein
MAEETQQKPQAPAKTRGLSPPVAIVLGLLKGGALGAGAAWLASRGYLPLWMLAMVLGVLAGAVAGKAPWRGSAWIATILKALVGVGVGYLAYRASGWLGVTRQFWIWLPAFGAAWCLLIEIDDAVGGGDEAAKKPAA